MNGAIKLHIPGKFFRKGCYGQLLRRGWIDKIDINVHEKMVDPKILYAIKQTPYVFDRRIHIFTCIVTSLVQEEDNVQLV